MRDKHEAFRAFLCDAATGRGLAQVTPEIMDAAVRLLYELEKGQHNFVCEWKVTGMQAEEFVYVADHLHTHLMTSAALLRQMRAIHDECRKDRNDLSHLECDEWDLPPGWDEDPPE